MTSFVSKFAVATASLILMSGNAAFAISGTPAQLCAEANSSSAGMDRARAYVEASRAELQSRMTALQAEMQSFQADLMSHTQGPPEDLERVPKYFSVRQHAIKIEQQSIEAEAKRIDDFELCIDKSK